MYHKLRAYLNCITLQVVKNLVLAGISVVIQDDEVISPYDLSADYFFSSEQCGQLVIPKCCITLYNIGIYFESLSQRAPIACTRVQDLNKYAEVAFETKPLYQLDDTFFKSFSVVLLSDCTEVS